MGGGSGGNDEGEKPEIKRKREEKTSRSHSKELDKSSTPLAPHKACRDNRKMRKNSLCLEQPEGAASLGVGGGRAMLCSSGRCGRIC